MAIPPVDVFFKYWLVAISLIAIVLYRKQISLASVYDNTKQWLPLLFSFIVLCGLHGSRGYSNYFTQIILCCLLIAVLQNFSIKRSFFFLGLAFCSITLSLATVFRVTEYGLTTDIFGVNKNILIISQTLTTCVIFAEFLFFKQNRYVRACLALSIIMALCSMAICEVRSAILGLFSVLPLFFLFKNEKKKALSIAGIALGLTILAFLLSGRLQAGWSDIEQFSQGNSNSSWGIRLELYLLSLRAFAEAPLFGWGAKSITEVIQSGIVFGAPFFSPHHYHSDFFNILASGGLWGTAAWLATIALLLKQAQKNHLCLALLFASLAMGLFDRVWFDDKPALQIFVCLWAILVSIGPKKISGT